MLTTRNRALCTDRDNVGTTQKESPWLSPNKTKSCTLFEPHKLALGLGQNDFILKSYRPKLLSMAGNQGKSRETLSQSRHQCRG